MTRVYRVEQMLGRGPYGISGELHQSLRHKGMYTEHCDDAHPDPQGDGIWAYEHYHVCGFKSLQQLSDWFKGYEKALHKLDYKVSEYDTDEEILEGKYQIMFDRDTATFVRRYDLDRVKDKL